MIYIVDYTTVDGNYGHKDIRVRRFRIFGGGARFRILGGVQGGGGKYPAGNDVVLTSMRRNDVTSTSF